MNTLPVPLNQPIVVFTDLDGTLIDHHTYSPRGSMEAVQALARRGAPLVFCSSKTFAEQTFIQEQIGIHQPFIFENGSAAAIPPGYFPEQSYTPTLREAGWDVTVFAHAGIAELRAVLARFPELKSFADATDAELHAATGLEADALPRARARRFTETLLTVPDEAAATRLREALQGEGFTLSRGGRFYTVQSGRVHKGAAVRWAMDLFARHFAQKTCFAAVGDSPNDLHMLEVVDLPFLVQRPGGSWAAADIPHLIRVGAGGPKGFSEAVRMLLGKNV